MSSEGFQALASGAMHWHQHTSAYAAIVLDGEYLERGDEGLVHGRPGDFIIHMPFEGHSNVVERGGAQVYNVPLSLRQALSLRAGRLETPLDLVRELASGLPVDRIVPTLDIETRCQARHEADAIASTLRDGRDDALATLAAELGSVPRTLRRQFANLYGMTAAQFRARARARRAWHRIVSTDRPLIAVAAEEGFADQAHMTRSVIAFTGMPPTAWRRLAV